MTTKQELISESFIERDANLFQSLNEILNSQKCFKQAALNEIIKLYEPLIKKEAARGFKKYTQKNQNNVCSFDDFFHTAIEGFILSLQKFNPELGFTFAPLAIHYIKNEIYNFNYDNASPVKISSTFKKFFNNLNKAIKSNTDVDGKISENQIKEICKSLNITYSDRVVSALNAFNSQTKSLEIKNYENNNSLDITLDIDKEYLSNYDTSINPENNYLDKIDNNKLKKRLSSLLSVLNKNEKFIINKFFLEKNTLSLTEISKLINLSIERIRQIRNSALVKLKDAGGLELKNFLSI
mgnify:CR=1 FL=1|tara:strand:+ start:4689 stop:5576 length:888 start_codon:yes stop_codon:yes gene_type:complete